MPNKRRHHPGEDRLTNTRSPALSFSESPPPPTPKLEFRSTLYPKMQMRIPTQLPDTEFAVCISIQSHLSGGCRKRRFQAVTAGLRLKTCGPTRCENRFCQANMEALTEPTQSLAGRESGNRRENVVLPLSGRCGGGGVVWRRSIKKTGGCCRATTSRGLEIEVFSRGNPSRLSGSGWIPLNLTLLAVSQRPNAASE